MSDDVYILIPVYNRRDTTLCCLKNLQNDTTIQSWKGLHIIVIDDGSTDGTESAIRENFPSVTILKGDGSLWWTGAIKQGMAYACQQGCDAVFWLNDDCVAMPGGIAQIYSFSKQKGNAIVGSSCYLTETGALQPTGAQGRNPILVKSGEVAQVDEMSGHCICIPREVIDCIGLPDVNKFPHYHGDSSYILSARRAGFSAYIIGDVWITHSGKIKAKLEDFLSIEKKNFWRSFEEVFINKKSLYYLPTQFYYNTHKYGLIQGTFFFCLKLSYWLMKWTKLTFIHNK